MNTNKQSKLQKYYDEHYSQYGDEVQFFPDPNENSWKFYVPKTDVTVLLVCEENGTVIAKYKHNPRA